jgi:hypothetical protein
MSAFLQKYGRSVVIGVIFFVVTNAMAVEDTFGGLTAAELSALTRAQVVLLCFKVLALAGTNLLAFLNQSVARAGQPLPTQPPENQPPTVK